LIAKAPFDLVTLRNPGPTKHLLDFRLRADLAPFVTIPLEPGTEFTEKNSLFWFTDSGTRMVSVRCSLHEWEQTLIAFTQMPRFTITDANGRFALSNVPPYSYRLELFHGDSEKPKVTSNITLFAGATENRNFRIRP
jgi:hypothetical protein